MDSDQGTRTPTRSRAPSRSRAPTPSPAAQHVPRVGSPTSSTHELTVHRESGGSGDVVATVLPSEDHTPLEDERVAPVQLTEDVTLALRTQLRKTLNRMGSVPPTPTASADATKSPFSEGAELGEDKISPGDIPLSPDAVVQTLEVAEPQADQYPPREYFILTHAGKPVFASRLSPSPPHPKPTHSRSGSSSLSGTSNPPSIHASIQSANSSSSIPTVGSPATLPHLPGSGTATPIPGPIFLPPSSAPEVAPVQPAPVESREEDVSSAMGLLQALISVFADDGDRIRCINAGRTRITFVLRAPLYYACVSSWGEPESVARLHLDYLHLQILTALTGTQLQRIFERRGNFDLRRLLMVRRTDPLIHALTTRLGTDMSITLASLHTMRIDPVIRLRVAELVLPSKDTKDVLYVILFSGDKVITLVRPRKHSIHPSDLHLLLNTLSAPALRSSASASWLPICLPKFNPQGFLYCYVSFLDVGQDTQDVADEAPIGLAFVTPDRDGFEKIRNLASGAETALSKANAPSLLLQAARASPYPVSELGINGLLHFLYKSRTLVQVTHPIWDESINQPRLITLYQTIHDALHAKSGQVEGPAKLQLIRTDTECVMGWITQPFELYLAVEPTMPKNAIVGAANAIARFQVQAYSAFLTVIGKDLSNNQSISHDQLLGGVAYYLTTLPHPYVRSFVTLSLNSNALWGPIPRSTSFEKAQRSAIGIRQAVHQAVVTKFKTLQDDPSLTSILPPLGRKRVSLALSEWLDLAISGSHRRTESKDFALPRLAFLSGLVLGLKDLEKQDATLSRHIISRSHAELVVSVAECLDLYAPSESDPMPTWDSDLALRIRGAEAHLDIVVDCVRPSCLWYNDQLTALDLSNVLNLFQNGFCFRLLEPELVKLNSEHLEFKPRHGFGQASLNLEASWSRCLLGQVKEDVEIAPETQRVTALVWHMLKTILFTTVLISQSVLDTIIYYSDVVSREGKLLARGILMALCRLSFVSTKFGALTAEGGGFSEMKRAFFGALDVLAFNYDDKDTTGDRSCVELVANLSIELSSMESSLAVDHPIVQGRIVYFLVCTEHVISQLPEQTIVDIILPMVQRHLSDAHNREVYEAAHSVMLAIFAAHESQNPSGPDHFKLRRTHPAIDEQNSEEDRLSTDQLRLAFQALVRSASFHEPELGWFCIEQIVGAIKQLTGKGPEKQDQILRLQLALVSAVPSISPSKLLPILDIVYDQIRSSSASRSTLSEAAYHEIVERLGDREKDIALRWWMGVKSAIEAC
ncbi:trafficking protein MON1 [Rhizoctonia solani]|uniref:Vacuolar fusion protein MON1 n=1 Tax=Rhizoctonia solani TaxID=456999 RepID=A0A8H8T4D9_9AGAM|nr:trafficking protein MON1 [Rhizoctonia solani]QRW27597.1 trafficking protein MON1 [Rhizoctonia solani]